MLQREYKPHRILRGAAHLEVTPNLVALNWRLTFAPRHVQVQCPIIGHFILGERELERDIHETSCYGGASVRVRVDLRIGEKVTAHLHVGGGSFSFK